LRDPQPPSPLPVLVPLLSRTPPEWIPPRTRLATPSPPPRLSTRRRPERAFHVNGRPLAAHLARSVSERVRVQPVVFHGIRNLTKPRHLRRDQLVQKRIDPGLRCCHHGRGGRWSHACQLCQSRYGRRRVGNLCDRCPASVQHDCGVVSPYEHEVACAPDPARHLPSRYVDELLVRHVPLGSRSDGGG